jgi:hypothetical protein
LVTAWIRRYPGYLMLDAHMPTNDLSLMPAEALAGRIPQKACPRTFDPGVDTGFAVRIRANNKFYAPVALS